jgi:hypothetical protein
MFGLEFVLNKILALLLSGLAQLLPSPSRPTLSRAGHTRRPLPCFRTASNTARSAPVSVAPAQLPDVGPRSPPLHVALNWTPPPPSSVRCCPHRTPSHFPFSFGQKPPMPSVSLFRSAAVFGTETRRHPFLPSPQSSCFGLKRRSAASISLLGELRIHAFSSELARP